MDPQSLKVSVALCTYNGARFLSEQLESIAAQTSAPAELVACDDGSSDESIAVLEEFAKTAAFPVRIVRNEHNLGSTKNFEKAIGACTGEIIALCDQDDIWTASKLDRISRMFARNQGVAMVFSDAEAVDESGRPLGYRLWESTILPIRGRRLRRIRAGRLFEVLLRDNLVTGATMAFRSSWRELLLPIPETWVHDGWIALLLSAVAPCECVPEALVRYRQHSQQQLGGRKRNLLEQLRRAREMGRTFMVDSAERYGRARERIERQIGGASGAASLMEKVEHFRARVRMRDEPIWRWPLAGREFVLGRYGRYSIGWKSFLQDLFLP
jgi:glycosyltransferase involved in cell wall biosynthesis